MDNREDQWIKNWNSLIGILADKNVLTSDDLIRIWEETK